MIASGGIKAQSSISVGILLLILWCISLTLKKIYNLKDSSNTLKSEFPLHHPLSCLYINSQLVLGVILSS